MRQARGIPLLLFILVFSGCITRPQPGYNTNRRNKENDKFAESLAHFAEGLICRKEFGEKAEEALSHFSSAAELDPNSYCIQSELARTLIQQGSLDKAIRALEKYCRKNPDIIEARTDLAKFCIWNGRPDKAIEHYLTAIKSAEPDSPSLYLALANLYCRQNQESNAIKILAEANSRFPDDPLILAVMAYIHLGNNNFEETETILKQIVELSIQTGEEALPISLYLFYAETRYRAGDHEKASQILKQCTEHYPAATEAFGMLGCVYINQNRFHEAEIAFEHITRINNQNNKHTLTLNFYLIYFETCYRAGHTEKAQQVLKDYLKLYPEARDTIILLAYVYVDQDRFKEAEQVFDCIVNSPGNTNNNLQVEFYLIYGETCHETGQAEKAEQIFEQCISIFPSAHLALNYLAYTWAEKGVHLDKALNYINRALEQEPDNGAYTDTLAWIYYKKESFDEAQKQIRQANTLMPNNATVTDHYGDILSALNKLDDAISFWQQSFLLDPQNKMVADKLAAHGINVKQLQPQSKQIQENNE